MYGGVVDPNIQPGIAHLDRQPEEQVRTNNITVNALIDNITKIKSIIKPVLNTQNGAEGLQKFTIHLNTVFDCIYMPNCKFTLLSANQNEEINVCIKEIRELKTKMDCIQCNYLLKNALKINPYSYVNNLTSN